MDYGLMWSVKYGPTGALHLQYILNTQHSFLPAVLLVIKCVLFTS